MTVTLFWHPTGPKLSYRNGRTMIYWATGTLAASLVLGTWAFSFKIDAAPVGSMIFMGALAIGVVSIFLFGVSLGQAMGAEHVRCTFDRNELGPQGTYGQWWWDIYKCTDGTERRVLVAGPRG